MISLVFEVAEPSGDVTWHVENDAGEYPPVEGFAVVIRDADGEEGVFEFDLGEDGAADMGVRTPDGGSRTRSLLPRDGGGYGL